MIEINLTFRLPKPWNGESFEIPRLGDITFLVGPNGAGKSKFAEALRPHLPNSRLLAASRMAPLDKNSGMGMWGDHFQSGIGKAQFQHLKINAANMGFGLDALILLEENLDLRIRVEATLSQIFDRKIVLEWDSGNMQPKAVLGRTGATYHIATEEAHGLKELLALLTHIYSDKHDYLIIDEPELHLHPQFQSFLMRELRRVAGAPVRPGRKKGVLLITHSPFILDFKSVDDIRSVISFAKNHQIPRHLLSADPESAKGFASLVPRLNANHKQLFFSDSPVFVEGVFDSQLLQAILSAMGRSVAAAGSCVIDAGGSEEVGKYVELARSLDKEAWFLYDLDSLFLGTLRSCIRGDGEIDGILASRGLGSDFSAFCGSLDRRLTEAVDIVRRTQTSVTPELREHLLTLGSQSGPLVAEKLAKARLAVLVQLKLDRELLARSLGLSLLGDIEGKLNQVIEVLRQKRVVVLPGGALENYLPSYSGNPFSIPDSAKRSAVNAELEYLSQPRTAEELSSRYGYLFSAAASLPAAAEVDVADALKSYLSDYVHHLQQAVVANQTWTLERIRFHLQTQMRGGEKVFTLRDLSKISNTRFTAIVDIRLADVLEGSVTVDENTNAGMMQIPVSYKPH